MKSEQPIGETHLANGTLPGDKPGYVKEDLGGTQQGKRKKGTGKQANHVDGVSSGSRIQEAAIKEEDKSGILLNGVVKGSEVETLGTLSRKQKKAKRKALNGVAPS